MQIGNRELIVVGDRLLIQPEDTEEKTKVGLYLPQTVKEKEPVQVGRVVATGPGTPIPNFGQDASEPWMEDADGNIRYMPMQARPGDHALFLKKEAVEVRYEEQHFLVVAQSSVLMLIRENDPHFHSHY